MKQLRETLTTQGVHTPIAQFTDVHGVAQGKLVPLAHLDGLLGEGAGFAGPSIVQAQLERDPHVVTRVHSTQARGMAEYARHVSGWETARYATAF
jgi:glutamine synthetase